jgi:hypothetical protein
MRLRCGFEGVDYRARRRGSAIAMLAGAILLHGPAFAQSWSAAPYGIDYTVGNVGVGIAPQAGIALEVQGRSGVMPFVVTDNGTNWIEYYGQGYNDLSAFGAPFRLGSF